MCFHVLFAPPRGAWGREPPSNPQATSGQEGSYHRRNQKLNAKGSRGKGHGWKQKKLTIEGVSGEGDGRSDDAAA